MAPLYAQWWCARSSLLPPYDFQQRTCSKVVVFYKKCSQVEPTSHTNSEKKLHARQYISQGKKRAVRDQGQTSSKFSFLKVLASSCCRKSCNSPLCVSPPSCLIPILEETVKGWCAQHHSNAQPTELTVQLQNKFSHPNPKCPPRPPHGLCRPSAGALYSSITRDRITGLLEEDTSPSGNFSHLLTHSLYLLLIYTSVSTW